MYAFITGASSGIGREMALLLAKRGYHLILVARREGRLCSLRDEITATFKRKVLVEACDLSAPKHCVAVFQKYREYPITLVINNAGFGKVGTFSDIPMGEELSMIKTNVMAVHIFTKLFADHMEKGRILNVSSMAGFQPTPLLSAYSATKAYVLSLSMAVNHEFKKQRKNIHISTLCPGPVSTEFNQVAGGDMMLKEIPAKKCAEIAIDGLFKNKDLIIPTFTMKLLHAASKLSPYSLVLPIEYKLQSRKLDN